MAQPPFAPAALLNSRQPPRTGVVHETDATGERGRCVQMQQNHLIYAY